MSANRSELASAVDQPFSLRGRVALVTGSTRGLGRAMAMGLGAAGAKVAINYANSASHGERGVRRVPRPRLRGHAGAGQRGGRGRHRADDHRDRRRAGARGHPRDQRDARATTETDRGVRLGLLPADARLLREEPLPAHARGPAAYEGAALGADHQHRLGGLRARDGQLQRLRRREGARRTDGRAAWPPSWRRSGSR